MRKLDMGNCCSYCFYALNYELKQMPYYDQQRAKNAGGRLSQLAEREQVTSLHTGNFLGFSQCTCEGCRSPETGDRWQLLGLQEERRDLH